MPTAEITINGVPSSNDSLPIDTVVQLSNAGTGGETTYLWELLDQPEGTPDTISNTAIKNPTIRPRKEGSYLLRLTVNLGQGTQVQDTKVVGIRQLKTNERIPSAFETFEVDESVGWKPAVNRMLRRLDDVVADANLVVAQNITTGFATLGDVVAFTQVASLKAGLPDAETISLVEVADATTLRSMRSSLGVVVGTPTGAAPSSGGNVIVRRFGLVEQAVSYVGTMPSLGDLVWVNDTHRPSLSPGSNSRAIGRVVAADALTFRWVIDGSLLITGRTESLPAIAVGRNIANWTPNLAGGYMVSTAAGDYVVPLVMAEGESLSALSYSFFGDGAVDLTTVVFKISAAGNPVSVASGVVTNGPAVWSDTTIVIFSPILLSAGESIYIDFLANAANARIGKIRPTYIRNV